MQKEITNTEILAWIQDAGISIEITERDFKTSLSDLGVDSLDFFSILEILEERSGVTISDEAAVNIKSLQDLRDYIRTQGTGTVR